MLHNLWLCCWNDTEGYLRSDMSLPPPPLPTQQQSLNKCLNAASSFWSILGPSQNTPWVRAPLGLSCSCGWQRTGSPLLFQSGANSSPHTSHAKGKENMSLGCLSPCLFSPWVSCMFIQPLLQRKSMGAGIQPRDKVLSCCLDTVQPTATKACNSEAPWAWGLDPLREVVWSVAASAPILEENDGAPKRGHEDSSAMVLGEVPHFWRLWISPSKPTGKGRGLARFIQDFWDAVWLVCLPLL